MLPLRRIASGPLLNGSIQAAPKWLRPCTALDNREPHNLRPTSFDALKIAKMKQKQALEDRKRKKTETIHPRLREGSNNEVLDFEIQAMLQKGRKDSGRLGGEEANNKQTDQDRLPARFSEIELEVSELSSTGDGLALGPSGSLVYVVPFTLPGDKALAKVVECNEDKSFIRTDFVKVLHSSPKRNDAGVKCKYFSKCSGCQLQMLSYDDQLAHKKSIVERAYANFSGLEPRDIPPIGDTYGSPLEYDYRTKLTPHFDRPKGPRGQRQFTEVPAIGFDIKGRRKVLDLEDCPIGSPIVREGFKRERVRTAANMDRYTNGATILVRETTERKPKTAMAPYAIRGDTEHINSTFVSAPVFDDPITGQPKIHREFPTYTETKTYTSDNTAESVEYVDDWKFTNTAGSFFQNNNSILSSFTAYIRGHILPPAQSLGKPSVKYLLDAYCGSGLLTITLSSLFKSTLGIDIDKQSVAAARANAASNNIENAGFVEADAPTLFADVPFPPAETAVVLDPPRKGCSLDFLQQLLRFGPQRVVYVSCNVHSQARDVGILLQGIDASPHQRRIWPRQSIDGGEKKKKAAATEEDRREEGATDNPKDSSTTTPKPSSRAKYEIESIRGFDFFPQTGHVECVTFLNRV